MSKSSKVCAAETCVRMRASPLGTTGKKNPTTYTPFSSIRAATFCESAASPSITGTIG